MQSLTKKIRNTSVASDFIDLVLHIDVNSKLVFLELAFSIFFYFLPKEGTFLSVIRIIFGIITFFIIPGYIISRFFSQCYTFIEALGFSLIFGLTLQTINVLILYAVFVAPIDFTLSIAGLTLFFTVLLTLIMGKRRQNEKLSKAKMPVELSLPYLFVIVVALLVRLYFQSFNTQMFSNDGATYMDIARNVAETGIFYSKIIPYHRDWTEEIAMSVKLQHMIGGIGHQAMWFILAIFFMFGGASHLTAKLMEVFCGVLIVFLAYQITRELLSERAAIIASLMIAFHPYVVFYSSGLWNGTETPNILFLMATFYSLVLCVRCPERIRYSALAGVFWGLSRMSWQASSEAFLVVIPFLFILLTEKNRLNIKSLLSVFLVPILIEIYLAVVISIPVLMLYVTGSFISSIFVFKKATDPYIKSICLFFLFSVLVMQIGNIRGYAFLEIFKGFENPIERVSSLFPSYSQVIAFTEKMTRFWQMMSELDGPFILILSFLSFLSLSRLKEKISIFLYPLFYSILFSIYFPFGFQDRHFPFVIPFMAILSSSVLDALVMVTEERIRVSKGCILIRLKSNSRVAGLSLNSGRFKRICLYSFLTLLIFFFNFYSGCPEIINKMYEFDLVSDVEMEPAVHWIRENTPRNSVFLALSTQEYAWLTNRTCVAVRFLDLEKLFEVIRIYKAEYLILDKSIYIVSPEISNLYDNPYTPPPGFVQVFYYLGSRSNVFVYSVTEAQKINLTEYKQQIQRARNPCLVFDGTDDYIKVPHTSSLNIIDQITIEAWIKLSETPTAPQRIVSKRDSKGESYLIGTWVDRKIYFSLWLDGNYVELASTSIPPDTWAYIAATYDGVYMRIYINGHLNAERPQTGNINKSTADVYIGAEHEGRMYRFNGWIDEVRISNRALTDYETMENSLKGELSIVNGTVALWHFNEGSGDIIYDETENDNDGMIYGATWHK